MAEPSISQAPGMASLAATAPTSAMPINVVPVMPGPTRKPGNLWTPEAREDMFNRREAGEGWETICQDYPNRSRHAMQQQYSMMKKQRALEKGNWAMNRRGRKRRATSLERIGRVGEISDDDLSDDLPESNRTMRLPPFSTIIGNHPPSQLRATTDPLFPRHLPAIRIPNFGTAREQSSSLSPNLSSASPEQKRQRFADYLPEASHLHNIYDQRQPKLPDLAFTEADVAALVRKGRDQAARIVNDVNHQLSLTKGQGPYAQELNRRDREIESLRGNLAALQDTLNARNTRCIHLENENAEIKARLGSIERREDTSQVAGRHTPPSLAPSGG